MSDQEQQTFGLSKRAFRENELVGMLGSPTGRNQLTELLRQCLNIPTGQLPIGTPFVQTILDYEFQTQKTSPPA